MLTNITLKNRDEMDPGHAAILSVIGACRSDNGSQRVKNIAPGQYLCTHWNFEMEIAEKVKQWCWEFDRALPGLLPNEYGVCDSPEQFIGKFGKALRDDARRFTICFVEVRKDQEPENGGWRWHKWGPYVGRQKPQCEYLYDEPKIDRVFTFHVYQVLEVL